MWALFLPTGVNRGLHRNRGLNHGLNHGLNRYRQKLANPGLVQEAQTHRLGWPTYKSRHTTQQHSAV